MRGRPRADVRQYSFCFVVRPITKGKMDLFFCFFFSVLLTNIDGNTELKRRTHGSFLAALHGRYDMMMMKELKEMAFLNGLR